MTPHKLPTLTLQPLAAISPSSFAALRACPLRAVWAARFPPLLPRSPKTRIGTVIHHLWEAAAGGRIGDEAGFDLAWQTEIAAQETEMGQDWKEAHLVPLSVSVSDLEVRRLRCRRQLTGWRMGAGRAAHRSEQAVADNTGVVKGRIDVITTDADGAHLIDLKTGQVTNADGRVKEEYGQQLKLYAALHYQKTNAWPASLTLRTADGLDWPLAWTPDECLALLAEALSLHAQINTLIRQGARGEALAKPEPDTCRCCLFRPACPHYRHARQSSPQKEWPADARGHLEQQTRQGNGQWQLRLLDDGATTYLRGLSPERQSFLSDPPAAVTFYNLKREDAGHYREGPMTTGYDT